MNSKRYVILDSLRGFTLIHMLIYHALWDMVYIFDVKMPWYQSTTAYIWQQCICCTFILLSGFCWSLGKNKLKRGLEVVMASVIISVATLLFMPDNKVLFGILSAIGTSMLVMIPLDKWFRKINPYFGALITLFFFILTRHISAGYISFFDFKILSLPEEWYTNLFTAYLGFPAADFSSSDYFSVFPWLFLYQTGYFLHAIFLRLHLFKYLNKFHIDFLEWMGRHSLIIYMLHQPVIYGLLYILLS